MRMGGLLAAVLAGLGLAIWLVQGLEREGTGASDAPSTPDTPASAPGAVTLATGDESPVEQAVSEGAEAGERIEGRVVSVRGEVIAGAVIRRYGNIEGALLETLLQGAPPLTTSGPDGSFSVRATGYPHLLVTAAGYCPHRFDPNLGALVVLRRPGATIRGRVLDAVGAPAANALVAVAGHALEPPSLGIARCDAEGRFQLALAAPTGRVPIWARAPEHADWRGEVPLLGPGSVLPLTIRLVRGVRVSGRVTLDGIPVRGVAVRPWRAYSALRPPFPHAMATTDTGGRYALYLDARAASWSEQLLAQRLRADGHLELRGAAMVEGGQDDVADVEIPMERAQRPGREPRRIEGRVFEVDGTPIVGIRVEGLNDSACETDEAGRYAVLGARAFDARALHPDGTWARPAVATSGDIHFPPRGTLRGRVVDAAGRPVPGTRLAVYPLGRGPRSPPFGEIGRDRGEVIAGEDGCFVARALAPGPCRLAARPPATTACLPCVPLALEVGQGLTDVGDVVLPRGFRLVGHVVDERGRPLAGAIASERGTPQLHRHAVSDAAGRFVLDGVDPQRVTLFVEAADHRFHLRPPGPVEAAPLEITLRRIPIVHVRLTGRVPEDLTAVWLRFCYRDGPECARRSALCHGGQLVARLPNLDPDEEYELLVESETLFSDPIELPWTPGEAAVRVTAELVPEDELSDG